MSGENKSTVRGIGFIGALQITFIVLKLCGVIDWGWWLVLIPLWFELALVALLFIGFIIYYFVTYNK